MVLTSIEKYLPKLEEVFFRCLKRLGREASAMLEYGVSSAQFLLMQYLDSVGQATVSEASTAMGVTLSAITSLSERLVSAGYVRRERDENDRRIVWLKLTPEGKNILEELQARRRRLVMHYLGELPEEEIIKLVEICEHLAYIIETKPPLEG